MDRARNDDDREAVVSAPTVVDLRSLPEKLVSDAGREEGTLKVHRRTGYAPTVTPDSIEPAQSLPVPKDDGFGSRYTTSDLLGEGGMGEVRLARDARIGRDVAMKVVRPGQGSRSDLRSRFLREARVQGQLEHPAIVPVYDLGARPDGAAFFTMKRVRGKTLEEVIEDLRAHDAVAEAEFPRRRLLSAFASICLALDFAHARGVVHRDLKPGNVMLGGFGEVYLLDWGLAKIQNDTEPLSSGEEKETIDAPQSTRGQTEAGAVMGTPGYMAPEQLVSTEVDGRADIYALGAILFEIVTLVPLHNRPKLAQVLDSTLSGPETRASIIAPNQDVPPELEAIWTKAVALKREDRYESAREMSDLLEGYLGGDRDLEQRRNMAITHVLRGEQAIARGRENSNNEDRKAAMRELGRALALDPANSQAMRAMADLLSELPADLPPEAQEELERAGARNLRATGRVATLAYASWFLCFPLVVLAGCRSAWELASIAACMAAATALSFVVSRQQRPAAYLRFVAIALSMGAIGICGRLFGPFMVVPALALSNAMGYSMTRQRRERVLVSILGVASFIVPVLLEWTGILAPSYVFEHGQITIVPHLLSFDHPLWSMVLLVTVHVMVIFTGVASVGTVRDDLSRHERHSLLQAWHFRQLAPDEARAAAPNAAPLTDPSCPIHELNVLTSKKIARSR